MLRIEVDTGSDWADRLRGPWGDLFADMEFPTPFHSLEWLESWSATIGRRARPHVIQFWEGHDLVGVDPLVAKRTPFPILRSMAVGPSDYLHPLVRRGKSTEFSAALSEYVASTPDQTFDFQQIRSSISNALNANSYINRKQSECLVLDLPGSFDEYLSGLSKSLRYDAKRMASKAFREKGARFIDADASNIQTCLDTFFHLHASRWRKRGLPGAFFGKLISLHEAWAPKAIEQGMLWLRLLEADGRPVGAIYAMRAGSTCFFYQAGMDPEAKALSPGTVLVASTIERAIEEGLTTFDFMRGDEAYKRRWKPQHAYANMRFVRPARGLSGTITANNMSLRADIEDCIRARLEGGSLAPAKRSEK